MTQISTVLTRIIALLFFTFYLFPKVSGQPTIAQQNLKKPKKYEEKPLGSEKTAEKKFTWLRRFTQNGVTKFNWHFNADAKLDEILARAKARHKDNYNQLLTFYNYTLDETANDKNDLDSVIDKANTGILIHDLRNAWIDNLYMLMGKAYYFRKELDTAFLTFQYINYAFSPKEADGYDKYIGSNANAEEGGSALIVSTKEKGGLGQKIWTRPPSRNESFIWQIRTYISRDEMAEAASLIQTLKNDPQFPARLQTDLSEVQSWWFYRQNMYDSAAIYLEKALDNATNREERARWEYLIAQLYERSGKPELAEQFFERTQKHTLNPVLEVYAVLNAIRQNKGDEKAVQESIDALVKMARKDKYVAYRDIIYFTAAQIELERNNIDAAKALFAKAAKYSDPSGANGQRTRAYLMLGELAWQQKLYPESKSYYDSVSNTDPSIMSAQAFTDRKNLLEAIVAQLEVIQRQDSLQKLAAMPEADREALIRKLVKKLRKQQGLNEDENFVSAGPLINGNPAPPDLFGGNAKGEWYFYNPSLKSKGFTEFKGKWGNRQNVDNWRRSTAATQGISSDRVLAGVTDGVGPASGTGALTYEDMLKNVPLTGEQMKASNDSIEAAQFVLGKAYIDGVQDYELAITNLEAFLTRFPYSNNRPEALLLLYYCYSKTGNTIKAAEVSAELKKRFAGTEYEKKMSLASGDPTAASAEKEMTAKYESIYNKFIEGNFAEALADKKTADSLYGTNYWTPQLLYIEALYHVRQHDDEQAKRVLQDISKLYPTSGLAPKAATMLDVLNRRAAIEDYLTKLQIERPAEDSVVVIQDFKVQDTAVVVPKAPPVLTNQPAPVTVKTETEKPAVTAAAPVKKPDTVATKPVVPLSYTNNVLLPHYVVIVLTRVDPVYVTEARNAFNRYNKQKYYNTPIEIVNQDLTEDTKLVVMNGFENAGIALEYLETTRAGARGIVPWLPADKYSFIMISEPNLQVLKQAKNLDVYKQFLGQSFPGKF